MATLYGNTLLTAPGYVEGLRFMNKLHNEGMFHPDWALETPETSGGKQFVAQIVSGRMGVFSHGYTGIFGYGWAEQIREQSPHAEWWPIDPFENAEGRYVKQHYTPSGIQSFVPATSSDESAANAIKYLNWLSSDYNRLYLAFGETRDVGGTPPEFRWHDKTVVVGSIHAEPEYWIASLTAQFPEYEEQIALELELSLRDGLPQIKTDGVSETEAEMQEIIRLKQAEWVPMPPRSVQETIKERAL